MAWTIPTGYVQHTDVAVEAAELNASCIERWGYAVALPLNDYYDPDMWERLWGSPKIEEDDGSTLQS